MIGISTAAFAFGDVFEICLRADLEIRRLGKITERFRRGFPSLVSR